MSSAASATQWGDAALPYFSGNGLTDETAVYDPVTDTYSPNFGQFNPATAGVYTVHYEYGIGDCRQTLSIQITIVEDVVDGTDGAVTICETEVMTDITTHFTTLGGGALGTTGGVWSGAGVTGPNDAGLYSFDPDNLSGTVTLLYSVGNEDFANCYETTTYDVTLDVPASDPVWDGPSSYCTSQGVVYL